MAEISKKQLIATSKEIVKRAIPYLIMVPLLLLLHFIILATWAYFYRDLLITKYSITIALGIILPGLAYNRGE